MRGLAIVLATGCWSAPATAPKPAVQPTAAPRMLPVSTGVRTARVILDESAWVDIAIDGDAQRAQSLCELSVGDVMRIKQVKPSARVARPCAADPLPAIRARPGSVALVQVDPTDEDRVLLERATRNIQLEGGTPAAGAMTSYTRFADRARCTRAIEALVAADEEDRRTVEVEVRKFQQAQLDEARRMETRACDFAKSETKRCIGSQGDRRAMCRLEVARAQRDCNFATEDVAEREARMTEPVPDRYPETRECRDE